MSPITILRCIKIQEMMLKSLIGAEADADAMFLLIYYNRRYLLINSLETGNWISFRCFAQQRATSRASKMEVYGRRLFGFISN